MAEHASDAFIQKVKTATGLVHLEGNVFWAQQQLIEKLGDPLARKLAKLIRTTETDKRDWRKILLALEKLESN